MKLTNSLKQNICQMEGFEDCSLWSARSHLMDGWLRKAHLLSNCKYLSNICTNLSQIDVLHIAQHYQNSFKIFENFFKRYWSQFTWNPKFCIKKCLRVFIWTVLSNTSELCKLLWTIEIDKDGVVTMLWCSLAAESFWTNCVKKVRIKYLLGNYHNGGVENMIKWKPSSSSWWRWWWWWWC